MHLISSQKWALGTTYHNHIWTVELLKWVFHIRRITINSFISCWSILLSFWQWSASFEGGCGCQSIQGALKIHSQTNIRQENIFTDCQETVQLHNYLWIIDCNRQKPVEMFKKLVFLLYINIIHINIILICCCLHTHRDREAFWRSIKEKLLFIYFRCRKHIPIKIRLQTWHLQMKREALSFVFIQLWHCYVYVSIDVSLLHFLHKTV